jgi:glutathione S-transferase
VLHETIRLDLRAGDQKKPEFLKLTPNGKVPTLVVDGTPMFEALAIALWLGDRFGVAQKLWPAADRPLRLEAMSWTAWSYVSVGPNVQRLLLASGERAGAEFHNSAQAALARQDADRLLGILDTRLASRRHLLGDEFSLADLVV